MPALGRYPAIGWRGPWHDDYGHRPPGFGISTRARLWIPVVVSFIAQVPVAIWWRGQFAELADAGPIASITTSVVGPLALIAARKYPGPVVAIVTAAAAADFFIGDPTHGPPYIALAFAIIGAIARGARIWAWVSVASGWVVTVVLASILGVDWHPMRIAGTTLGILIVIGIGEAIRTRREHVDELGRTVEQRKQSALQAERVRIARELHDVLAHSLSQIHVQAGVGLHLMEQHPEKAAAALASIKETSKTALDEVRSVLGVLRAEDGQDPPPLVPEPDFSRLPGLAASVTAQGVSVSLSNSVNDAPKAVQLAIYRIAQESLTNVVRHAHGSEATVEIRSANANYVVTIADNGNGASGVNDGGGRGLLGMRERAELLGGTLETGRSPSGGFLVTAQMPKKEACE